MGTVEVGPKPVSPSMKQSAQYFVASSSGLFDDRNLQCQPANHRKLPVTSGLGVWRSQLMIIKDS